MSQVARETVSFGELSADLVLDIIHLRVACRIPKKATVQILPVHSHTSFRFSLEIVFEI